MVQKPWSALLARSLADCLSHEAIEGEPTEIVLGNGAKPPADVKVFGGRCLVQQRILDYEMPAYLMDTDDPEALKDVFARLNSTGVRMRPDEVFQALLGPPARRRGSLDLAGLQQACDLDGFGEPPRHEVLKAVLAMSGHDSYGRREDLGEDVVDKLVGVAEATEALQRTVAFLQAPTDAVAPGAGIPAYSFVPYPVAFVILARWFYLFPDPDRLTRTDLSRWLWRGVVSGVHQHAAVSPMRLQMREIIRDEMPRSLDNLLRAVGEPSSVDWSLGPFHAHQAASRVELLTLLAHGPRDRRGPVSWRALVTSGERVAREIFGSPAWKSLGEDAPLGRTSANRALLDARRTGLQAEFKTWSSDSDRAALESHLIDTRAHQALLIPDVRAFLQNRAARLRSEVSRFLSRRAGLGMPRIRPVETYFDSEPSAGPLDTTAPA